MQMFPDDLPLANIDADGYCCHFMRSSVRPTIHGLGFVYCIQSDWKKWPTIWHADVSRWLTLSIHGCLWILLLVCLSVHLSVCSFTAFSGGCAFAKEGGSHYWEMAVAITCGYGGYLLPLLAAHSSFNRNYNIFIQENAFESVVCDIAAMLSRPQCVKMHVTAWWILYFYTSLCQGKSLLLYAKKSCSHIIILWMFCHSLCLHFSWDCANFVLSFSYDNGMGFNRWQAIIWTNDGLVYWCIYMSFSLDELRRQKMISPSNWPF